MKKSIFLLCFALMSYCGFAQHAEGDINVNVGVGLLSNFNNGDLGIPPIGISGEYGIKEDISVGGYLGFSTGSEKFSGLDGKYKYTYIIVGARASYHFLQSDKLDPYAGLFLGYIIGSSKWTGDNTPLSDNNVSGLGFSGHVGARYQLNDKFRVFGELGYGIAVLQLGLSFQLER